MKSGFNSGPQPPAPFHTGGGRDLPVAAAEGGAVEDFVRELEAAAVLLRADEGGRGEGGELSGHRPLNELSGHRPLSLEASGIKGEEKRLREENESLREDVQAI